MKANIDKSKGITLVALVVTVIILLILAGISIASLTGNGLFEKAKLAKEKQENAQIEEDDMIGKYENIIQTYTRDNQNNSSYSETIIWNQEISSGTINFLNNYTINDFDEIIFVYENKSKAYAYAYKLPATVYKYIVENQKMFEIDGYDTNYINFKNMTINSIEINSTNAYIITKILGIKY